MLLVFYLISGKDSSKETYCTHEPSSEKSEKDLGV